MFCGIYAAVQPFFQFYYNTSPVRQKANNIALQKRVHNRFVILIKPSRRHYHQ